VEVLLLLLLLLLLRLLLPVCSLPPST